MSLRFLFWRRRKCHAIFSLLFIFILSLLLLPPAGTLLSFWQLYSYRMSGPHLQLTPVCRKGLQEGRQAVSPLASAPGAGSR